MEPDARDDIEQTARAALRVVQDNTCGHELHAYGRRFICEREPHDGQRHETADGRLSWIA